YRSRIEASPFEDRGARAYGRPDTGAPRDEDLSSQATDRIGTRGQRARARGVSRDEDRPPASRPGGESTGGRCAQGGAATSCRAGVGRIKPTSRKRGRTRGEECTATIRGRHRARAGGRDFVEGRRTGARKRDDSCVGSGRPPNPRGGDDCE